MDKCGICKRPKLGELGCKEAGSARCLFVATQTQLDNAFSKIASLEQQVQDAEAEAQAESNSRFAIILGAEGSETAEDAAERIIIERNDLLERIRSATARLRAFADQIPEFVYQEIDSALETQSLQSSETHLKSEERCKIKSSNELSVHELAAWIFEGLVVRITYTGSVTPEQHADTAYKLARAFVNRRKDELIAEKAAELHMQKEGEDV